MRIIILCAGKGERWGNFLGVPKQMVRVGNERLLERTLNMLKKRGISDIHVTVPIKGYFNKWLKLSDFRAFEHEGKDNTEMDKIINCEALMTQNTILLWGDVYFTDEAMDKILNNDKEYCFFGRKGPSQITNKPYCEVFGLKVNDYLIEKAKEVLKYDLPRKGSWELYKLINNYPIEAILNNYRDIPNHDFIEIDDMTEDIDCKEDYEELIKRI